MLTLERIAHTHMGTFGELHLPKEGLLLYTVEPPWLNNRPGVSCIPAGVYELEPHSTEKYPDTWALVGGSVSHWETPDADRFAILFHVANTIDDIEGCIGPGTGLGAIGGDWAVLGSRPAMERLRKYLHAHPDERTLMVRPYIPEYP